MTSNDILTTSLNTLKETHMSLAENLYLQERVLINRGEADMMRTLLTAVQANKLPEWKEVDNYLDLSLSDSVPINSVKLLKLIKQKNNESSNVRGKRQADGKGPILANKCEKQTLKDLVNSLNKCNPDDKPLNELNRNLKADNFNKVGELLRKQNIKHQVNINFEGNENTMKYTKYEKQRETDDDDDTPKTDDSN